jgi:hypothetical protein
VVWRAAAFSTSGQDVGGVTVPVAVERTALDHIARRAALRGAVGPGSMGPDDEPIAALGHQMSYVAGLLLAELAPKRADPTQRMIRRGKRFQTYLS